MLLAPQRRLRMRDGAGKVLRWAAEPVLRVLTVNCTPRRVPATAFFAAVLIMVGCFPQAKTPTVLMSVNSFSSPNANLYRSYVVLPLEQRVQASDLEFQEYAGYLRKALAQRGLAEARTFEEASLAIFLGYGVGEPREHVYSYSVPVWGQTGVSASHTTTQAYDFGGFTTANSRTTYQPSYGVTGYRQEVGSYTTFSRYAIVSAVDVGQYKERQAIAEVWKTTIVSVGESGDLRAAMPFMVSGATAFLAESSGGYVPRSIPVDDPHVQWLRSAPPPEQAAPATSVQHPLPNGVVVQ